MYYLYVKKHNKTGLKYLGYTSAKDPCKYKGSGIYWKSHLKIHGEDFSTELLAAFDNKEDLRIASKFWSEYWNVVESKQWANLIPEDGIGFPVGLERSREHSDKLGNTRLGSKHSIESKRRMSLAKRGQKYPPITDEHRRNLSLAKRGNKNACKTHAL